MATAGAVVAGLVAAARRLERVEVTGGSMLPTLQPGDRLVVLRGLRLRAGDVVALADPREPRRTIVKRVAAIHSGEGVHVSGDDPSASTDSRHFGPVAPGLVHGRAIWRYWPPDRRGRLRA